jgi:hypothetical protein
MEKTNLSCNVAHVKQSTQGRTLKLGFAILFFFTMSVVFGQQSRVVRGKILDQQQQPVIGAGVAVKDGTQRAVHSQLTFQQKRDFWLSLI